MFTEVLEEYRIAYIGRGNLSSTADQVVEKLSRILRRLHESYGVAYDGTCFSGLSSPVLLKWYAGMVQSGLSMSTRNNYVALLNPFLSWAMDMEMILVEPGKKPVDKVLTLGKIPREDMVPESERKTRSFTAEEVRMLIRDTPARYPKRDRAILALFLASGIRVSELCSLNLSSVVGQPQGQIYLRRKGGSWKHTEVADFFYTYIDDYLKERDLSDLNAPLFLTRNGKRFNRKAIWDLISRKELFLGLQTGVHILRHTTLSNVEKKGGAGVARDVANHSSLFVTNRYTHTTHEERRAALNEVDWNDL